MPPTAARIGVARRRGLESSPRSTSNLISRPTIRKNTAISPSLTQASTDDVWAKAPIWTGIGLASRAK